jgi:hypothetical protein
MFGTTSAFDYETSYQQTTVTGAVAGWFTIPRIQQQLRLQRRS